MISDLLTVYDELIAKAIKEQSGISNIQSYT